jgi:hypothetical protein
MKSEEVIRQQRVIISELMQANPWKRKLYLEALDWVLKDDPPAATAPPIIVVDLTLDEEKP